jgi:hypothetical protein
MEAEARWLESDGAAAAAAFGTIAATNPCIACGCCVTTSAIVNEVLATGGRKVSLGLCVAGACPGTGTTCGLLFVGGMTLVSAGLVKGVGTGVDVEFAAP